MKNWKQKSNNQTAVHSGRVLMATSEDGLKPLISLGGSSPCRIKVSSVLNRDTKQFGKKFMFDDDEETCWNSDQGTPQYVMMELPTPAAVRRVVIRFQGGFAGKECVLKSGDSEGDLKVVQQFYPQDNNSLQCFSVSCEGAQKLYQVVFNISSDFYGRITVYELQLYGTDDSVT